MGIPFDILSQGRVRSQTKIIIRRVPHSQAAITQPGHIIDHLLKSSFWRGFPFLRVCDRFPIQPLTKAQGSQSVIKTYKVGRIRTGISGIYRLSVQSTSLFQPLPGITHINSLYEISGK